MKRNVLSILLITTVMLLFAGSAFGIENVTEADSLYYDVDLSIDSTTAPVGDIYINEALAGDFEDGEVFTITLTDGLKFADSTVTITSTATGLFDTSGVAADTVEITPTTDGSPFTFKLVNPVPTGTDTIKISGIYAFADADYTNLAVVSNDSTTIEHVTVASSGSGTVLTSTDAVDLYMLPGAADELVWVTPSEAVTVDAGIDIAGKVLLNDQFGNQTTDRTTAVTLSAVLNGTTTPGNGTLTGDLDNTGDSGGERNYDINYTRAEVIQLVASASGLTSVTNTNAITVEAAAPANITANYSKTSLTVDQTTSIAITVTDAYYNAVDNTEQMKIEEIVGGGGTFDTPGDVNPFALDGDGKATVVYTPSKFYTGTVKIKISSVDVSSVIHNKTITVNPGALGNVAITPATVSDTVGTHTAFEIELLDTYGNHIDATATSEVTITQEAKDEGDWTTALNSTTGIIEVDYTVGKTSGENDTLLVETVEGNFTDSAVLTKLSGPPATMKFLSLGDSVFVAGDLITTETLSDTAWDEYGNLSDGYDVVFSTNGDGIFANGLSKDTITTSAGLAEVDFRADSLAGDQTLTVSYGDVSKSFDVTVWPNEIAKVVLSADPTSLVAGQKTTLTLKAYDAFGVDGAGNHTITSDPNFVDVTDIQAIFAFQDSAGASGDVGQGTFGTVDTTKNAEGEKKGDYFVEYTAYTAGPDSARIVATLDGVIMDTIVLVSAANAPLGSFVIAVTSDSVVAGSNIEIEITAKDTLGIVKHDYAGNVRIKLEGSSADSVNWTDTGIDTTGFDVVLPAPFSAGELTLNLKDLVAESGLIFSIEDTATGISKEYAYLSFYPAAVDSLPITIVESNVYAGYEFHFTVTPKDEFGNVNTAQEVKFYMTANYPDDLNLSSAARFIKGPKTYAITSSIVRAGQQLKIFDTTPDVIKNSYSPVFDVQAPDAVAPVVAITAPADGAKLNSLSVAVTGTVVDESAVTLTVNGEAVAVVDGAFETTLTFTGEGDTVIYAKATDPFDNVGDATVSITIDKTKPVFANMTPADAADIIEQKPAISVDVTDALAGVDTTSIIMTVDADTVVATLTAVTDGYAVAYTPTTDLDGGLHTVTIEAADLAGNAAYDTTSFTVSVVSTKEIALAAGYNLVSVPVDPVDATTIGSIFPNAIAIYGYDGTAYVDYSGETLVPGMAFWVASLAADTVEVVGYDVTEYSVELNAGFNLIGALSASRSFGDIVDADGILVSDWMFGYNTADNKYELATALEPCSGYWVAATKTGTIELGAASPLAKKVNTTPAPMPEWVGRITVGDKTYSFGKAEAAVSAFDIYDILMPPCAPGSEDNSSYFENSSSPIFNRYMSDVRSEVGSWVFNIEKGQEAKFDVSNIPAEFDVVTNINGKQINLRENNTIVASKAISIEVGVDLILPEKFVLHRNYPNPFNPTTNIKFEIPTAGHVSLEVYNVLGAKVRTLTNTNLKAGRYEYQWDGMNDAGMKVTSGIYFYRIQTADHQQVMKMMLMK